MKLFKRKSQPSAASTDEFAHITISEHTIDGIHFRVISNPAELPYLRMSGYYLALADIARKVTTADLFAFVDEAKDALNKQNLADLGFYLNALEANLTLYTSFYPIFDLGTCMILLDGEPMAEIPAKFNDRKMKHCEASDEIKAFFLKTSLDSFQNSSDVSETSQIMTFLQGTEHQRTTGMFLESIETMRGRLSPTDLIKRRSGFAKSPASSTKE